MAITLYYRNTTGHVGTLGSTGNFDLETTTGTTASQSFGANTPRTYVYYSATTFPDTTDWATGDYTWYLDVTTANANVQLTTVKVSRYNSALNSELASGSASPNLTLNTTGLKSGTVSFASPNPGGRSSTDRLVITLTFSKLAGGGVQSVSADVNGSGDSRIDTPLVIPIVRDISEDSVSISDSIAAQVSYIKPISNEDSISASDSIEGTKIPAEPENELYSVHFVEFPEEVSDSVYVPAPQQVEQVSTTKTHKYDITATVSTTKTHKYDVIEKITATKTHLYNVVRTVDTTKVHLYNIIGKVTTTKTHLYNILNSIQATKTHLYNVLHSIALSATHKYNILEQISTTKTHKYDVEQAQGTVSTTKTHKYHVEGRVSTTKTHLYDVLEQISTTKTHKFDIITQALTTKTHKFDVIAKVVKSTTHLYDVIRAVSASKVHLYNILEASSQVTKSTTHIYNVLEAITKTVTHKFNIIALVTKTVTHKFNITSSITQTVTHKFNIVEKIVTTKTHLYNLFNRVTPDATKTHKYNIIQQIQRTRTHKYNIIGRLYTTRTHKYDQGGTIATTKTHKYDIGAAFELQELGGSTNAYVRFQDRVQIIDIIADLNNLAISNVEIPVARPPPNIAVATVAIAEYVPGSKLLTASVHKPRHRIASRLIIPQVIDTIDNLAVAPYIGIEVLPLSQDRQFQTRSHISLHQTYPRIHLSSHTQLTQDNKTKIRIASSTMLQQTEQTRIESKAQLEIPPTLRPIVAPEIMSRQKAKVLKTLINLLSSDHLFGS